MRRVLGAFLALTLVAGVAIFLSRPDRAGAQGGGSVEVTVTYAGPAQIETLKVNKDTQACGTEAKVEKVVVGANKGLEYAVVSVPGLKGAPTAKKAVVDQHGCKFVPHVIATMPGEVDFKNSDGILHNLHTYSTANPAVNKAQPKFKKVMAEKFEKPEIIKLTCDVHSWMLGWVAVMPTPFFAVTNASGTAKIDNVPAGKHKVEVWHEVLGKLSKDVDVKAGQVAKVSFQMKK
jgi:plastocyanin